MGNMPDEAHRDVPNVDEFNTYHPKTVTSKIGHFNQQ